MARVIRTPVDYALLEAIGRYRLFTIPQGVRLGLANEKHVAERLRSLSTAGLVLVTERGKLAGPHVFCLSKKGAAALEEWTEGDVKAPFRAKPFGDTEHLNQRVIIADWHIALRSWADRQGIAVNWVQVEFDANPGELQPLTVTMHNGQRFDPDAVASITDPDGTSWLIILEAETGGRAGSLANYLARLGSRLDAMEGHLLEKSLGWPQTDNHRAARLLFVFKNPAMMEKAKMQVGKNAGPALRRVFMASAPLDAETFDGGWWRADNTQGCFLRAIPQR